MNLAMGLAAGSAVICGSLVVFSPFIALCLLEPEDDYYDSRISHHEAHGLLFVSFVGAILFGALTVWYNREIRRMSRP